jgi:hypothetical protein
LIPSFMKRFITLFAALVTLVFVPSALAASASLFGGATMSGNQVRLVSDVLNTATTDDFSGVNLTDTGVTTFASLTQLSTKFNVTDDDCAAGSPRFQLNIDGKNVFVYLGPSPTFMGCTPNTLVDSGNLIGNNEACRYDTSQLAAGTQCNTYAGTLALLGTHAVTGIQLVVDSGFAFADKEQTVLACDIVINSSTLIPCEGAEPGNGIGAGQEKVTICHKGHTIRVGKPAVKAHMRHGDHMGACTAADKKKAKAAAKAKAKARLKAKKGR